MADSGLVSSYIMTYDMNNFYGVQHVGGESSNKRKITKLSSKFN